MLINNPYRLEEMDPDEVDFVKRRYISESRSFHLGMRWVLLILVILPLFVVLLHNQFESMDGLTDKQVWLYAQIVTLFIYVFVFIGGYVRLLLPLKRDLINRKKVMEMVLITEKKFMPQNNTFHFYINSIYRCSIEVDQHTYDTLDVNDELCIEYTARSEIYLGYF